MVADGVTLIHAVTGEPKWERLPLRELPLTGRRPMTTRKLAALTQTEVGGDGGSVRKGLAEKAASRRLETAMCSQATGRWFRGCGQGYQL